MSLKSNLPIVLDQWALFDTELAALKNSTSEAVISSFKKVNLHPDFRISFQEWMKLPRVRQQLGAGANFEAECAIDKMILAPAWWQGMEPSQRKDLFDLMHHQLGLASASAEHFPTHASPNSSTPLAASTAQSSLVVASPTAETPPVAVLHSCYHR